MAVNHGGDCDSTGAIAGNLLGLMLGMDAIPAKWLNGLELRTEIEALAGEPPHWVRRVRWLVQPISRMVDLLTRPMRISWGETCSHYDPAVRLRDAIEMLAGSEVGALGPTTWADLGCGTGTFTLALADLLAPGSVIHAMDRDGWALRKIPFSHKSVSITTHRGDFTHQMWPFDNLDGILMANSLHYVNDQTTFIRACEARMRSQRRFLVVEYDTHEASRWVPYPVPHTRLAVFFTAAGYSSIRLLRSRPSVYRRAALYAALITSSGLN